MRILLVMVSEPHNRIHLLAVKFQEYLITRGDEVITRELPHKGKNKELQTIKFDMPDVEHVLVFDDQAFRVRTDKFLNILRSCTGLVCSVNYGTYPSGEDVAFSLDSLIEPSNCKIIGRALPYELLGSNQQDEIIIAVTKPNENVTKFIEQNPEVKCITLNYQLSRTNIQKFYKQISQVHIFFADRSTEHNFLIELACCGVIIVTSEQIDPRMINKLKIIKYTNVIPWEEIIERLNSGATYYPDDTDSVEHACETIYNTLNTQTKTLIKTTSMTAHAEKIALLKKQIQPTEKPTAQPKRTAVFQTVYQ